MTSVAKTCENVGRTADAKRQIVRRSRGAVEKSLDRLRKLRVNLANRAPRRHCAAFTRARRQPELFRCVSEHGVVRERLEQRRSTERSADNAATRLDDEARNPVAQGKGAKRIREQRYRWRRTRVERRRHRDPGRV